MACDHPPSSGDTQGVTGDGKYDLNVTHIGDLAETQGKTWKVYVEGWPGKCFLGMQSGRYVRKHNPFISYKNIQSNPERCKNIVNATELSRDIADNALPDLAFYIPDLDNDGHDTSISFADKWYGKTFGPLLDDQRFSNGMLLVSTFDESGIFGGNQIYTSFWGPSVSRGTQIAARYDHCSLHRTIEDILNLGNLGRKNAKAEAIVGWE